MSVNKKNVHRKGRKKVKKVKKKNKKLTFLGIVTFLLFEAVFTVCTFPFILLYGPFDNAKSMWVGAAMTTMSHQWLATAFLSDEKIAEIQGTNTDQIIENSSGDEIVIPTIKDDTIEAKTFTSDNGKYTGYYLVIKDPTRIQIGYSSKLGTEGETTSQIAENNEAVAAINGGAFTDSSSTAKWTGNGGRASGLIMHNGEIIFSDIGGDTGKTDLFAFTAEGKMIVGNYSIKQLRELGVKEALSFYPILISNGRMTQFNGDGGWGISSRTAIGQRKDGAVILLVIDGRSITGSKGASIIELQQIMNKLGAHNAINLDGGKSTTMYYEGDVINTPSNSMGERPIPSAVIVK